MVVMPGTVFMFNDYYEVAVFLFILYCFIYGVVWTIQGFRKRMMKGFEKMPIEAIESGLKKYFEMQVF